MRHKYDTVLRHYNLYNAVLPNGELGIATVVFPGKMKLGTRLLLETRDLCDPSITDEQVYIVTPVMPDVRKPYLVHQRRVRPFIPEK